MDPRDIMGASRQALTRADLVEINEALAAQYLAVERELGLVRDCTNRRGRAILAAMKALIGTMLGAAALLGTVGLAQAGEQTGTSATVNPAMLINNVLRQPVDHQQRQVAFDEALREPGPTPANRTALNGEVQPDGSVRYGNVTVSTIKNPCPPGEHVELPSPPLSRRARK